MNERFLEIVQAAQEEALQHRIDNRVRYQGESAEECDGYGQAIPLARRKAVPGCRMCVHCQSWEERRHG